jgi:PKD repeat protein
VLGYTDATDFLTTADAYQPNLHGSNNNIFLAQLYANGTTLKYSTYLGGTGGDTATDLATDPTGNNTYFIGYTTSSDFPVTPGANQTQFITPGHDSAIIARFTNGACFVGTPVVPNDNAPQTVTFTDTTTNSPTSWNWNFGDGGTSILRNPTYIYTGSGSYNVTLTTNNALGITTLQRNNYIVIPPPTVAFTATPTTGTAPLTVQFTDDSKEVETWNWNFGDGGTSSSENPVHTYNTPDTYTVTLTANNTNSQGTFSNGITVKPANGGSPSYGQPNSNPDNGYTGPQPAPIGVNSGGTGSSKSGAQLAPPENPPSNPVTGVTALPPVQNPTIVTMVILTLQEYQFWLILAVIVIILVAILRRWWIRRQNPLLFRK